MDSDVLLSLFLELDLVPVIVQCNNCIDWVAELGHQKQGVDGVDQILVARINGPVAIEDRMADATMTVDIGMVDGRNEAGCGREHRVISTHLNIEQKCATSVRALRWAYNESICHNIMFTALGSTYLA
jgi:hypothetical protein